MLLIFLSLLREDVDAFLQRAMSDDDDECYYDMSEVPERSPEPVDEELDESFYQIDADDPSENIGQAHIDEPFTPTDDLEPNFHYTILTAEQYCQLMMKYVEEVKEILQLASPIVKLLLHFFHWNKQRLLEQFYEMEHEQFFRQAKLLNPFSVRTAEPTDSSPSCGICYSDTPSAMFHLQCEHHFCHDCWKAYLTQQIVHEGLAQTIVCPDSQCDLLIADQTILRFLHGDEFVQHLYQNLILNSYVEHNPRARWCPGKNCGQIIHATSLTSAYNYAQLIVCSHCQTSFCFQCTQPWHDPIKCRLLLQWNKKLLDEDSNNILLVRATTKACPNCQVNIEKNGGCNHMTCRSCRHEFCWLCFGHWSRHTQCNQFEEQGNHFALLLTRFQHYHNRFRSHEHSLELETKLFKKISRRRAKEISPNVLKTRREAFEVLLQCRQMLTYTYPFAYYLCKSNQSIVFEQNQGDLERACEELSGLLEGDPSQIRRELDEKTKYCQARRAKLLQHVKEGYANDYWQYQDGERTDLTTQI